MKLIRFPCQNVYMKNVKLISKGKINSSKKPNITSMYPHIDSIAQ